MMTLNKMFVMAGVVAALCLGTNNLAAQGQGGGRGGQGGGQGGGRGGFDPAQMQQRMMENIREQFGVKDDTEWKAIEPLIQKVMDARREVGMGGGMRMMFRRPGGDTNQGDQGNQRRRFGGEPNPAEDALMKAIDSKASKEELKTAMANFRKARQAADDKLKAAQDELKKVLTVQQEAPALAMGLVN
jgi:hypothetical protein